MVEKPLYLTLSRYTTHTNTHIYVYVDGCVCVVVNVMGEHFLQQHEKHIEIISSRELMGLCMFGGSAVSVCLVGVCERGRERERERISPF